MNLESLENLIKEKGRLSVHYDAGGGGVGLYWSADINRRWPYCSGSTLEDALYVLVSEHNRLKKEALQKQINAIDESSNL